MSQLQFGSLFFQPLNVKVSPVKGDDVSQQQAPLVVGEFAVEEEVFATQKICRRIIVVEKKKLNNKKYRSVFLVKG